MSLFIHTHTMLSFEAARTEVLNTTWTMQPCKTALEEVFGRILAEPLVAKLDSPRFTNSSVDGFAVRAVEVAEASSKSPVKLPYAMSIAAGDSVENTLPNGHTARIFTGAPLPDGADAVVMQEDCVWSENRVQIKYAPKRGENIRPKADDYKKDETLLPKGTRITPPVMGLLAANGFQDVRVFGRPRICILCTGSELVEPGKKLQPGQIYNSNGLAIATATQALGLRSTYCTVPDDRDRLRTDMGQMWNISDVLIICGGVSVGEHDLVRGAFQSFRVEERFWGVSMRPGKPFYFGVKDKTLVFGLPGNPVSALVCFHLFVRPSLLKLVGYRDEELEPIKARLTVELDNKDSRTEFVRGVMETGGLASPLEGRGSHMLTGLAQADCLICLPPKSQFDPGSEVATYPINWFR